MRWENKEQHARCGWESVRHFERQASCATARKSGTRVSPILLAGSSPPPPPNDSLQRFWIFVQIHSQYFKVNVDNLLQRRSWRSGKISASQSWGPGSIRGLNIWVIFFHVKVHSAFQPSGVGKMNTNIIYINRFEAAARGAYIEVNWSL